MRVSFIMQLNLSQRFNHIILRLVFSPYLFCFKVQMAAIQYFGVVGGMKRRIRIKAGLEVGSGAHHSLLAVLEVLVDAIQILNGESRWPRVVPAHGLAKALFKHASVLHFKSGWISNTLFDQPYLRWLAVRHRLRHCHNRVFYIFRIFPAAIVHCFCWNI